MPSPLSFANSSSFRNNLLARNLEPYQVSGVYTPPSGPITYETQQSDFSVINSPDELMTDGLFSGQLYPLNQFGPNGGYNLDITYNGPLLPVNPNQGEYNPTETALDLINEFYIDAAYIKNIYGPDGGFNDMVIITDIQNNNKIYQPYWDPPTFVPSSYSPYSILLSSNPVGNNGLLSQDSYLAKLGAEQLNILFKKRVDAEIFQNTVALVNLESLSDPFNASLIAAGKEPLIYQNWQITVAENPIVAAADFITRLGGAYWPVSPIPGDYFNENVINGQTPQVSNALNITNQLTGGFLGSILNLKRNPSEIFLANTGNAQRSALFRNIDYNKYRPDYGLFGGLLGFAQGIVNLTTSLFNPNGTLVGGYYVGSRNAEPSTITSPPNQLPINPYGQQVETPVYGPSEMGILFEGNQELLNFGLAGKPLSDGGGIDGQFVWTSPKYKGNAGFKATPGGGTGSLDSEFNQISSDYTRHESTNINFKDESILDQTQRLIDSADNVTGISRLKHVGNAINQVSKVFNDGYKEITKGSRVISYRDFTTGAEEGVEYCRIFTKDTPYYTYSDLQKTDGITNAGRRFSHSILDNTYNLNIAPIRNPGSTNIIPNNEQGLEGYAKKYMFSIENLAWRTSSRPGFTYDELPVCEKGPNGGRVMWFPPYDLKFTDQSTANWNSQSFLGRPEPIFTYKDTNRSGTLSWKIIVDHPSILNVIVKKHLKTNKEKMNSIIDSFFAGCTKYDIYQLALKYNTIPTKDLYTYQEILNNPRLTDEETVGEIISNINTDNTVQTNGSSGTPSDNTKTEESNNDTSGKEFEDKFNELAFYFHNDRPDPNSRSTTSSEDFNTAFTRYQNTELVSYQPIADSIYNPNNPWCKQNGVVGKVTSDTTISNTDNRTYNTYCSENKEVTSFWNTTILDNYNTINDKDNGLVPELFKLLNDKKANIRLELIGSASAPASKNYNVNLSKRRIDSVKQYLINKGTELNLNIKQFIDDKKLIIPEISGGEEIIVTPKSSTSGPGRSVNCTNNIFDGSVGKPTDNSQRYSVDAMACRRVKIKSTVTIPPGDGVASIDELGFEVSDNETPTTIDQTISPVKPRPITRIEQKLKEGLGKKILRQLLSECDYFEVIEKEVPMLYDSIKEKIKYFNPAFHSMTPEGLNSRLTFLNQCVRPGETIPIIDSDGNPIYSNAVNTSFGTPPVLVLRIGDFYNSKIIPKNVSFSYEPLVLDMNPEGIGVQPMIVNVTMGFDFIGGMGLKEPVEQLQNALSFNYYANTEIYDERSVATDDSFKKVDELIKNELQLVPLLINGVAATDITENAFGDTIGTIINTNRVTGGEEGEISYQTIMDKMLRNSPDYLNTITNQLESVVLKYNYGILQLLNQDRDYKVGVTYDNVTGGIIEIYGKPIINDKFIDLINKVNVDIENTHNPILVNLKKIYKPTENEEAIIKVNMIKYINVLRDNFLNDIQTIITELSTYQQNLVLDLVKIGIINGDISGVNGFDGKKTDKGVPLPYIITGTDKVSNTTQSSINNTFDELRIDINKIYEYFDKVNNLFTTEKIITKNYDDVGKFNPVDGGGLTNNVENKTFYMIVAREFNDENKLNGFINYVLTTNFAATNKLRNKFEKVVKDIAKEYRKELENEEKLFENFRKNKDYIRLFNGVENELYPSDKTRILNYTTILTEPDKTKVNTILSNLFSGNNTANKSEFFIQDIQTGLFNLKFN
jgi:outer membrane protein OmpA-like peptidoglycan-associated protein